MDGQGMQFVAAALASLPPRRRVLEVGSLDVNGSARGLFTSADVYQGIDLRPGRGVDVVADGATYRPEFEPDTVVCLSVLEHTPDAEAICRNAAGLLSEGGAFIISAPIDGYPAHNRDGGGLEPGEYYRNVEPAELRDWLAGLTVQRWEVQTGQLYVVAVRESLATQRWRDQWDRLYVVAVKESEETSSD